MIKDRIRWFIISQLGFNPKVMWRSLRGLPRYIRDLIKFKSLYTGRIDFYPALNDWGQEGGMTSSEYFWQDLLVAQLISKANPKKHIDIGSRIDGFVAHVASFRDIEVFDVRPITRIIPGVRFIQADLMKNQADMQNYCDSLSCLHAIEHFGLGRYGDPIDIDGYKSGLASMADFLQNEGTFYLSTPVGINRVEFNANRVFDPKIIIDEGLNHALVLQKLIVIDSSANIQEFDADHAPLRELASQHYALGIFIFKKQRA